MLTQGNQASGMAKAEFGGMMEKDIEDMTIAEYIEYEAKMERHKVLDYPYHLDDYKINAYYDLPSLLHCFKPVQPHTKDSLNLHVMADLGTSVNVMPKSIFKHFKVANLKENDMVVEMADMTEKFPLGIVENILVKINKFLFLFDFVIIDKLGEPSETMILGRPFLATIHAHIDIFNREISLRIGEDRVLFDMDGGVYHSKIPVEKVYMVNFVQEEEYFNPLKIKDAVFSYKSPTCLLFEQCTRSCINESIDTLDSVDNMQELEVKHEDIVGYGNKSIDDTTREGGHYEGLHSNSNFNDNGVSLEATMYENLQVSS
ncbi:phospholipase-like protein [Tanacetum coccineum]|uniref:Phospholipase-like protein n=1 Tax=Tanacetum coccineum TaxID=301880 RepID=A0ABQ5IGV4_9ASTR